MTKAQLIERWQTGNYKQILANFGEIFNELHLTQLKQLAGTFEGRIDCRGLPLPSLITDFTEIENLFENIDFSYAEIGQRIHFECCQFTNCLFKNSILDCAFWGSQINHCQFIGGQINTRFGYARERKPAEKGKIKVYYNLEKYGYENLTNCVFNKVTFKKYAGIGAICKHCVFEDCKFNFYELDGIFEDCQFIGRLRSVVFTGYQIETTDYPPTETTPFNSMKNVDFSRCEMTYMEFRNDCDLSQIIPPDPSKYVIFKHTLALAKQVEELGIARGMDKHWLWYHLKDLYKYANVSRDFYLQKFPQDAESMNNNQYFEIHAKSNPWRMVSVNDYLTTAKEEDMAFTKNWFEICCKAKQMTDEKITQ